jgi:hypothetical protein
LNQTSDRANLLLLSCEFIACCEQLQGELWGMHHSSLHFLHCVRIKESLCRSDGGLDFVVDEWRVFAGNVRVQVCLHSLHRVKVGVQLILEFGGFFVLIASGLYTLILVHQRLQ